jgi:hypothetical protein
MHGTMNIKFRDFWFVGGGWMELAEDCVQLWTLLFAMLKMFLVLLLES